MDNSSSGKATNTAPAQRDADVSDYEKDSFDAPQSKKKEPIYRY
jgi:hypothetical protein